MEEAPLPCGQLGVSLFSGFSGDGVGAGELRGSDSKGSMGGAVARVYPIQARMERAAATVRKAVICRRISGWA